MTWNLPDQSDTNEPALIILAAVFLLVFRHAVRFRIGRVARTTAEVCGDACGVDGGSFGRLLVNAHTQQEQRLKLPKNSETALSQQNEHSSSIHRNDSS